MRILISDANIFIDIDVAGLINEMFQSTLSYAVPDVLYIEELSENHSELPGYGLRVMGMPSEVIADGERLHGIYPHPSSNDLLALALAKHNCCPLLTGDSRLRSAAECEAVEVHGTLWLLEQLLNERIIDLDRMEEAYKRMKNDRRRLPWGKVAQQIKRLKGE